MDHKTDNGLDLVRVPDRSVSAADGWAWLMLGVYALLFVGLVWVWPPLSIGIVLGLVGGVTAMSMCSASDRADDTELESFRGAKR